MCICLHWRCACSGFISFNQQTADQPPTAVFPRLGGFTHLKSTQAVFHPLSQRPVIFFKLQRFSIAVFVLHYQWITVKAMCYSTSSFLSYVRRRNCILVSHVYYKDSHNADVYYSIMCLYLQCVSACIAACLSTCTCTVICLESERAGSLRVFTIYQNKRCKHLLGLFLL